MVSPSEVTREHSAVNKIKSAILDHGNPFAVGGDILHNMITHAWVPGEFVEQILNANYIGQKMYEDYVTERTIGNSSLSSKVTKVGYRMFMSGNKTSPIKLWATTVDLKETKDLYGRLMILAKQRHWSKRCHWKSWIYPYTDIIVFPWWVNATMHRQC